MSVNEQHSTFHSIAAACIRAVCHEVQDELKLSRNRSILNGSRLSGNNEFRRDLLKLTANRRHNARTLATKMSDIPRKSSSSIYSSTLYLRHDDRRTTNSNNISKPSLYDVLIDAYGKNIFNVISSVERSQHGNVQSVRTRSMKIWPPSVFSNKPKYIQGYCVSSRAATLIKPPVIFAASQSPLPKQDTGKVPDRPANETVYANEGKHYGSTETLNSSKTLILTKQTLPFINIASSAVENDLKEASVILTANKLHSDCVYSPREHPNWECNADDTAARRSNEILQYADGYEDQTADRGDVNMSTRICYDVSMLDYSTRNAINTGIPRDPSCFRKNYDILEEPMPEMLLNTNLPEPSTYNFALPPMISKCGRFIADATEMEDFLNLKPFGLSERDKLRLHLKARYQLEERCLVDCESQTECYPPTNTNDLSVQVSEELILFPYSTEKCDKCTQVPDQSCCIENDADIVVINDDLSEINFSDTDNNCEIPKIVSSDVGVQSDCNRELVNVCEVCIHSRTDLSCNSSITCVESEQSAVSVSLNSDVGLSSDELSEGECADGHTSKQLVPKDSDRTRFSCSKPYKKLDDEQSIGEVLSDFDLLSEGEIRSFDDSDCLSISLCSEEG